MNEFEGIGTLSLLALLYFLPAIVAMMRGHRNAGSVTILNLFLGWTFVGWVAALVWSAADNVNKGEEKTK